MGLLHKGLSQHRVDIFKGEVLLELSPVERDAVDFEPELGRAFAAQIQVRKADAELFVKFGIQGMTSLALVFDQIGCLLAQLGIDLGQGRVGVCAQIEDLPGPRVGDADFCLKLPLQVGEQRVVEFIVLAKLRLDFAGVAGGQEVLEIVELVRVGFVLEGVDGDFVQNNSLLKQQEPGVHQPVACRPEDVPLLREVPQLPAGVHDEDDNFLLVHVALPGLVNHPLLFLVGLVGILTVDVLHVQLDIQRVDELHLLCTVAGLVFVEELGHLVLRVPEHYRSRAH